MKLAALCLGISFFGVGACATEDAATTDDSATIDDTATSGDVTTDKVVAPTHEATSARPFATAPIRYHGGSIMASTSNSVYYIWYGNWTGNSAVSLLTTFAKSIGGSPYFNINTTYTNKTGGHVPNAIRYGGSTTDNYSQGTALDDNAVQQIVSDAITSGRLPRSSNAVYFVLTSSDVDETSGMCSQYCGWHYFGTIAGSKLKYSFIGNPDRCPTSCEEQTGSSPNGNPGADGMASILAHELEETVTDPYVSAWYDSAREENGDKCAWTFGAESTASNGSLYNVSLGGKQFLIQQNWNASTQRCAMKL